MSIVTFTSDFGSTDYYVASVKGQIYAQAPDTVIVDVTHEIPAFNISQAAFVIKQVYRDFPQGTIHLIAVDPGSSEKNKYIVAEYQKHLFVAPDNGILSLVFDDIQARYFEIKNLSDISDTAFPSRDILGKATGFLAKGGKPEILGGKMETIITKHSHKPIVSNSELRGVVIYVDRFGNCISNIDKGTFNHIASGRSFKIYFSKFSYVIKRISKVYSDVPAGETLAIFNASGLLQISINKGVTGSGGGASQLFGLKVNSTIRIEFND